MRSRVTQLLPSYYFPGCFVIITECGHRSVRPAGHCPKVGDYFDCPFEHEV